MHYLAIIALLMVDLLLFQNSSSARRETSSALNQDQKSSSVVVRDALALRKAETALELFEAGRPQRLWKLLRRGSDPGERSWLIYYLPRRAKDPRSIIRRLQIEKGVSARRALLLALGEYSEEQLPSTIRLPLMATLLNWYRNDPDSGIHSAIDWLLRHRTRGDVARRLDWQGAQKLNEIDRHLIGALRDKRNWYVTSEGQTIITIARPREFVMGSPDDEFGRTPDEARRRMRIPRSFAIASKEITIAEFRRFLEANPDIKSKHTYPENPDRMAQVLRTFSPDDDCPQIAVTWYEAAMYCNWLSKQEGLPASEWVYPTNANEIKDGMELARDYLQRTGYRLPTEAEWEYAARAGSTTARFFGSASELLDEYAWYSKKPLRNKNDPIVPTDPQRTWPVGQLKPNDWGLFDVYGNVWEWIQNRRQEYSSDSILHEDREDIVLTVSDTQARTRRGGSFSYGADVMRSAHRGSTNYFPNQRRDNVGFRVARTYVNVR